MTVCVYGLSARVPGRLTQRGVAGEPLQLVTSGSVSAIVGLLPRRLAVTRAGLRRYHAVVEQLARRVPALLPARFGTTVRDVDELRFVLTARQAAVRRRLRAVRNRTQMTVRLIATVPDPQSPTPDPRFPIPGPRSGRRYLLDRAAQTRRPPRAVETAVKRWVREQRVERRSDVTTVYHLIPRGSVRAYVRAVEKAAAAAGVRVLVTGPWAPYAFADNV